MVKMLLSVLVDYKEKKLTKKAQIKNYSEVIDSLIKGLNETGYDVIKSLSYNNETDNYYSIELNDSLRDKLDDMLVDILGS